MSRSSNHYERNGYCFYELHEVSKGSHVEPSIQEQYSVIAELYLGKQNHDIEMAQEIWSFFKDKTL